MQRGIFSWLFSAKRRTRVIRTLFASAVVIMAVVNVWSVLLPARPGPIAFLVNQLDQIAPFGYILWPFLRTGRNISLIFGFFLFILATGLARGKRQAWLFTVLLLPSSALGHLLRGLGIEEAVLTSILCIGLLRCKDRFMVKSDPWRMHQGLLLLIVGFGFFCCYVFSGLTLLQDQLLISGSIRQLLRSIFLSTMNIHTRNMIALTWHARWFLDSLGLLTAIMILTGLFFLLRPVSLRWWLTYQKERMQQMLPRTLELVGCYGKHTLSFFATREENLHYFSNQGEGLVSYRLNSNVAMTLGDAICAPEHISRVTQSFLHYCDLNDWSPVFYQARSEYLSHYQRLGLRCFKIGEEAFLAPQTFTLTGSAMANVRTTCRRAERDGVSVRWYEGPLPEEALKDAQALSQTWLKQKEGQQGTEMGFSMGRSNELDTMASSAEEIATLLQTNQPTSQPMPRFITGLSYTRHGDVCGMITFTPIYGMRLSIASPPHGWGWSLDTMRRAPDASPGVIELLIVRAMERFREQGAEIVSLGMVAMADTHQEMTVQQTRAANFITEHSQILESHRTLFKFKQKFHPTWESRYIVTDTMLGLPGVALALLRLHQGNLSPASLNNEHPCSDFSSEDFFFSQEY